MRSALVLSALLLLLLPPRSLSETGDLPAAASNPLTDHITSSKSDAERSDERQAVVPERQAVVPATTSKAPPPTQRREASTTTSAPVIKNPSVSKNQSLAPSAATSAPSAAPTQKSTAVTTTDKDGASLAKPPTSTDPPATQGSSQSTLPPTTKSTKPDPTHSQPAGSGAQSSPGVSTTDTATQGTGAPASASPLARPTGTIPTPSTATPTRRLQPATTAPLKPLGSSSQEPDKITITSSSLGTETSPGPTLFGATTMPTSSAASQGNQQYSSKVPAVPGPSSSVTETASSVTGPSSSVTETASSVTGTSSVIGTSSSVPETSSSEALQPAGPSSGPVATSVTGPGSFITPLAPNTPVSRMCHPPSTPKDDGALPAVGGQIRCGRPENQTEGMLVLNFTKTSPCVKDFSDDHLVELLCKAAKATFNAAKDKCRIQLAPIAEDQAVAVKEITIQTNLSPADVYESLKDKWDELKQAGVSNMQLGDQGPPEETEDRFSMPLIITIVCMASFLLLVAALYGCCHQRFSQRKDQQRLTEELQTVENGYHDNPTLEVMETSSEMQEKKVVSLNGELGDSWIVPLDNLTKDDLDEEEDTHL